MRILVVTKDRPFYTQMKEWITDYCEDGRVRIETDFAAGNQMAAEKFELESYDIVFAGSRQEPMTKENVCELLENYLREQASSDDWFSYESQGKQMYCRISDILYFESEEKRIRMVRKHGEDSFYGSIKELAGQLSRQRFLRCHRCLLVNYDHIAECSEDGIVLSRGGVLPVSRRRKQEVMEQLQELETV